MEKKSYFFCISISIIVLAAIANQIFIETVNSDTLYVFELASNVVHHTLFLGQNVPAAPYFFPDTALVVLLNLLTHNISILHFYYSILFLSVFCFIVYELMFASLQDRALARLGTLIALAGGFFLMVPYFYFLQEWAAAHLSIILFSLAFLLYYLKNRNQPLSIAHALLVFTFTFLFFISDNLVFAQLLFPLSIVIMIDIFRKRTNKQFGICMLLLFLVAIVLGAKIEIVLNYFFDITISNNISLFRIRRIAEIDKTIALAMQIFEINIRENKAGFLLLLGYHIATLIFAAILFSQRRRYTCRYLWSILIFFYIAEISNIILSILVGKITEVPHMRYLDIIFIFPPVALSFVLMHALKIESFSKITKVSVLFIFLSGSVFLMMHYPTLRLNLFSPPYPRSVECIDALSKKYKLSNGLAEYWNVRLIRNLSKENLKISQINKKLSLYNFTDNKTFIYTDLTKKAYLSYQFVIVNRLPKNELIAAVGQPDQIRHCANHEIWLFLNKNSNLQLNQYVHRV